MDVIEKSRIFAIPALRTYLRFREQLLQSKAEVVDKIGKRK